MNPAFKYLKIRLLERNFSFLTSIYVIKKPIVANTIPFIKITKVFKFGAQVIAAANATKNGDQ